MYPTAYTIQVTHLYVAACTARICKMNFLFGEVAKTQ